MKLREAFSALEKAIKDSFKKMNFAQITTVDGVTIEYEGELGEGSVVMILTEEGSAPAPDGEHTLTDGRVVVTEGGVVVSIREPEAMKEDEKKEEEMSAQKFMAEISAADGSLLILDPALEVGAAVMVATPEGNIAASDGPIELASGQVIEVVEGRVESITSIEGMKKRNAGIQAKIEVQRTEVERRFSAQEKALNERFTKLENVLESMASVVGRVVEAMDEKPVEPKVEERKEAFQQVLKPEVTPIISAETLIEFQKRFKKK